MGMDGSPAAQRAALLRTTARVSDLAAVARAALDAKLDQGVVEAEKVEAVLTAARATQADWERLRAEVVTRPEAALELAALSETVLSAFLDVIDGYGDYVAVLYDAIQLSKDYGAIRETAHILGETALDASAETAPRV